MLSKNPVKVKAGRIGATKRWAGKPRAVIRLAEVNDPALRDAYIALQRLGESRKTVTDATKNAPTVADTSVKAFRSEVGHDRPDPTL